jgi:hypothetical protein
MPSVSIGMNEVCAPALLADSGPATPSIAPWPKREGSLASFFSAAARQHAERRAERGAAQHGGPGELEVRARRPQPRDLFCDDRAAFLCSREVGDDLAHAEQADRHHREFQAVRERGETERETCAAGIAVGTDEPEQEAEDDHGHGLEHRAMGEHDRGYEAEQHEREIFRRAERLADLGERRREHDDHDRGDRPGKERGKRGDRERGAGASLPRHLMAVDAGDDRGGLTGKVDQDGRGRSAVLRAVENTGEHDKAGDRLDVESERQQHRDGRDWPDAG